MSKPFLFSVRLEELTKMNTVVWRTKYNVRKPWIANHFLKALKKRRNCETNLKLRSCRLVFRQVTGDKTVVTNYRPISLTCICVKIMERIVQKQLLQFLNTHSIIPINQHGFLPKKSVVACLLQCLNIWTSHLDKSEPDDVVYVDFEKSFDRISHRCLLLKLEHAGVKRLLLKWIKTVLSNHTFPVKVGTSYSDTQYVLFGVPQRSVLGPILFSLHN